MKIRSLSLMSLLTGVAFAGGAFANSYTGFLDVPSSHWAYEPVRNVSTAGIMNGPGNQPGYFNPAGSVNRAELATVASRLLNRINHLELILAEIDDEVSQPSPNPYEARNAQRRSDINTILNAVYQYAIDENGNMPFDTPAGKEVTICRSKSSSCGSYVNLDVLLGTYLVTLPVDPSQQSDAGQSTGYTILLGDNGRVTVSAPLAEGGQLISVTR